MHTSLLGILGLFKMLNRIVYSKIKRLRAPPGVESDIFTLSL